MKYRVEHFLKNDYLEQMIGLDAENYSDEDRGVWKVCMEWYKKNPDIYTILLNEQDKVIGYINFAPLTQKAYALFKKGLICDMQLTKDDILPFSQNAKLSCLFMSIVIQQSYRKTEAVKVITDALYEKLKQFKNKKNITIERILADCVSENGVRYISRQGYTEVLKTNRNTFLYEKVF